MENNTNIDFDYFEKNLTTLISNICNLSMMLGLTCKGKDVTLPIYIKSYSKAIEEHNYEKQIITWNNINKRNEEKNKIMDLDVFNTLSMQVLDFNPEYLKIDKLLSKKFIMLEETPKQVFIFKDRGGQDIVNASQIEKFSETKLREKINSSFIKCASKVAQENKEKLGDWQSLI